MTVYRFNSTKVLSLLRAVESVIAEAEVGETVSVTRDEYDIMVAAFEQIAEVQR